MKKCPYCAEEIQEEAIKCKHCGSNLKDIRIIKRLTYIILAIIGLVFFVVALVYNLPNPPTLANIFNTKLWLLDVLTTPSAILGILLIIIGILQFYKHINKTSNIAFVEPLTEKEKLILNYFVPFFLLAIALQSFLRAFSLSDVINIIFLIIGSIIFFCFLVLTYKSASILRKHNRVTIAPIFWLLLLFIPISNLIAPIVIWVRINRLKKLESFSLLPKKLGPGTDKS